MNLFDNDNQSQLINDINERIEYKKNNRVFEYLTTDFEYTRIALIDADYIPYKVAYSTNNIIDALKRIHHIVEEILEETESSHFIMFHTTSCNFRHDLIDNYKANRTEIVKSPFYYQVRDAFFTLYETHHYKCYEADDLVTMCHRKLGVDKSIIVTPDKDMLSVYPARIYNPNKKELIIVDEPIGKLFSHVKTSLNKATGKLKNETKITGYGTKFLFFQMLIGDTADNIKGVYKVGAVKAFNLLNSSDNLESMYNIVLAQYSQQYAENALQEMKLTFSLLYMRIRDETFKIPKPKTLSYDNEKQRFLQ
jgi:5'-3' exonuclease